MDKDINNNGFDYVDLGLPSGTLWATMNIGASSPSDFGLYFQWGDTIGYTEDQLGFGEGKKKFIWDDYKWYLSGSPYDDSIKFKKYTVTGDILDLEDDAAHVNMGGDWHMPTPTQIQELINETTHLWTTQDGVNGMTFTSKKDESKFIFIPAAGFARDGSVRYSGDGGLIWSSMLHNDYACYGQYLYIHSEGAYVTKSFRQIGLPVRGVIDRSNDNSKGKKDKKNDELNLVEILKNVPKGTKLWSPVCGECELVEIDGENTHPIICRTKSDSGDFVRESFAADGKFFCDYKNGECVLFPSKGNRDWSTFKVPKKHKHFEPFQKVLCATNNDFGHEVWAADFYSHYDEALCKHYLISGFVGNDNEIIPFEGNEDKLGTIVK